jgi:hypothetical protein
MNVMKLIRDMETGIIFRPIIDCCQTSQQLEVKLISQEETNGWNIFGVKD